MTHRRSLVSLLVLALLLGAALLPGRQLQAQGGMDPVLDMTMYSDTLIYRTLPFSVVNAELTGSEGRQAEGFGFADADGLAVVTFFIGGEVVHPGDEVSLSNPGGEPVSITVPTLAAKADVEADLVTGVAPAGAAVSVSVTVDGDPPQELARDVVAADTGTFTASFVGEADFLPGGVSGSVTITTADGDRVTAPFETLSAQMTLGARSVSGQASPGTEVTVTRRITDTVETLGQTLVTGAGGWSVAVGDGPAIAPGQRITVSQAGGAANETAELAADIEAVTVSINQGADTVFGTAPPDTELVITGDDMAGNAASAAATSDGSGAYSADLSAAADLGTGWRVRTAYEPGPAVSVGGLGVVRMAQFGVGLPFTQGRAEPGIPITGTLFAADGTPRAQNTTIATDQGTYELFLGTFGPGGPSGPEPGETIELSFTTGDPLPFQVPALTAASDVDGNSVAGEAPADGQVRVVTTSDPQAPVVTTTADAAGLYRAAFDGYTLERPANGVVFYTLPDGNEFFTSWAAIQLFATRGSPIQPNFVTGNAPLGTTVHVELRDEQGRVVGEAESPVFGGLVVVPGFSGPGGPQFFVSLTDITGTPVEMEPGDTLAVTAGDEAEEVEVPPIDSVVLVQANTITGRTRPNAPVTIMVSQRPPAFDLVVETTSDAAGNFVHDFAGELTLRHGDLIQLQVGGAGEHNFMEFVIAPGLLLDMDQGLLAGVISPDVAVDVTLTRAGTTLVSTRTFADETGAFAAFLMDETGAPLIVEEGDEITAAPDEPSVDPLELTVPRLEVDHDIDLDTVSGMTTVGGDLTMLALEAYFRGDSIGIAQAWPAIALDGSFAAQFVPAIDVRPGRQVIALYRPPEGHYAFRTVTVPILNAEHSGPNACGFGVPRDPVSVELLSADQIILGDSATTARFDGYFATQHRNSADEHVPSAATEHVVADLSEAVADVALPQLDVQVNWQQSQLVGRGPPNSQLYLAPAVPCPSQFQPGLLAVNVQFGFVQSTDDEGNFQSFVPPFAASGLEVAFFDENDHRFFRHVFPARAELFIRTDRVRGQVNALDEVSLVLSDDQGVEKGAQEVTANGFGRFAALLERDDAGDVRIEAGDVLTLTAGTGPIGVPVEPLSFDWSTDAGVVTGQTVPNRGVTLWLRLDTGQVLQIALDSDELGRFGFEPVDVPPRASWSMDDVTGVRVGLPMQGGHIVFDQTADFETGPGPESPTIYLPSVRNRSFTAAGAAPDRGAAPRLDARPPLPGGSQVAHGRAAASLPDAAAVVRKLVTPWRPAPAGHPLPAHPGTLVGIGGASEARALPPGSLSRPERAPR